MEIMKKAAGYKAAELIKEGMIVGLGTGSTTAYFIEKLAHRCQEGLRIQAVASSSRSFLQASSSNIPILNANEVAQVDLTVDGADEIDTHKRMIKGGGGAFVREKILANMSRELIIIIDESKWVSLLGKHPLPVEVIPFGIRATLRHIEKAGYTGHLRLNPDKAPYITDNGNYIVDLHFAQLRNDPERDHETLIRIPGVVDTGFFFHLAGRVIVGFSDGQVIIKQ